MSQLLGPRGLLLMPTLPSAEVTSTCLPGFVQTLFLVASPGKTEVNGFLPGRTGLQFSFCPFMLFLIYIQCLTSGWILYKGTLQS